MSTFPLYLHSLNGTDSIVGLSTALTTVAAIFARPFAGIALDKIGRRVILLLGALLMMTALYLYTVFDVIIAILLVRIIAGFGWGISTTSSNTIATDIIPKERFGEGMGFFSLSQSLSLALAPMIGLVLYTAAGIKGVSFVVLSKVGEH